MQGRYRGNPSLGSWVSRRRDGVRCVDHCDRYRGAMAQLKLIASGFTTDEEDELDPYSRLVVAGAERVTPSVANLRVARRVRGGRVLTGGGSGVVITADGFLV